VKSIDINFDGGEGFEDRAIAPFASTIHIACGGHTGDTASMNAAIRVAKENGLAIGAHPSYPDREHFGRKNVDIRPSELASLLESQILPVLELAERAACQVSQVKLHGALYHRATHHEAVAYAITELLSLVDRRLLIVGVAGGALDSAARAVGLRFVREGFADRRYRPDGTLAPRSEPDALIQDPARAAQQALRLDCDSVCVHSDTPNAAMIAAAVRDAFAARGVKVKAP
jgi:UPF0271 protein